MTPTEMIETSIAQLVEKKLTFGLTTEEQDALNRLLSVNVLLRKLDDTLGELGKDEHQR